MKVYVDKTAGKQYKVVVKQGVQYFTIGYEGSKQECQWMAKQFRTALKAHDREHERRIVPGNDKVSVRRVRSKKR